VRRFHIPDTRKDPPNQRADTLGGVISTVELSDVEVDELADLEVGGSMTIDGIVVRRTE
jgi:hypothetical protein